MDRERVWEVALGQLQLQMTQATFDTWVQDTHLVSFEDDALIIGVKNAFAKDWLENRLFATINRTVTNIVGQPIDIQFVLDAVGGDKSPGPGQPPENGTEPEWEPDQAGVELFNFDPTQRGFVMTSNYATRFWQPYLNSFCYISPFVLWVTLKSFAFQADKRDTWPSINTLADICANGDRQYILGRAARKGRKRVVGALEVLEDERIVYVKRVGSGRKVNYKFRVLENLPLLTPAQIELLSRSLQNAHRRWIEASEIDYEEWEQLTLPILKAV